MTDSWDRKTERSEMFHKRNKAKDKKQNRARTKGYRQSQLREKDDINDIKDWEAGLFRDRD
jgi:hypothetical protein